MSTLVLFCCCFCFVYFFSSPEDDEPMGSVETFDWRMELTNREEWKSEVFVSIENLRIEII